MREIPAPAKERWPRFEHKNFYWAQEDYIRERQAGQQWHWTIFRPQIIFGYSIGSAMNLIPAIGALAAICREENRPMGFPGTSSSVLEAADARLLARAFEWAATADAGHDDTFNITNGDVFIWPNVWPAIAAALNVETEPGNAVSLRDLFRDKASVWDEIVRKHGLRPLRLHELVGRSDFYADMGFNFGADRSGPGLVSTIKIRQRGFGECLDTEDAFAYWLNRYIEQGVLPPVK
jgi:nucleoside-diphosphate-sugar epimerase